MKVEATTEESSSPALPLFEPSKKELAFYPAQLDPENTNSIVVDLGSESIRIGHAFSDRHVPRYDVHSTVGVVPPVESDTSEDVKPQKCKYIFDKHRMRHPVKDMETKPMIFDGLIHDWDMFAEFFELYIEKDLNVDPKEYLFMFSEANHTSDADRHKLAQLLFEKFGIKGFYSKPSAVFQLLHHNISKFGTVIDLGATHASVTPCVDLCILKNSYWKADQAGNYLVDQALKMLERNHIDVIPEPYIKTRKTVLEDSTPEEPPLVPEMQMLHDYLTNTNGIVLNRPTFPKPSPRIPQCTLKDDVVLTKSYHRWGQQEIAKDFVQSICAVWPDRALPKNPIYFTDYRRLFAFPDGRVTSFCHEGLSIAESLFDHEYDRLGLIHQPPTLPEMVVNMLKESDSDIQDQLMANMCLTGGVARLPFLHARLKHEIDKTMFGTKLLPVSRNPRFDAYRGATKLAVHTSMAALWYSKAEYDEGSTRLHDW